MAGVEPEPVNFENTAKSICASAPDSRTVSPLGGEVAEWFKAHAWKA